MDKINSQKKKKERKAITLSKTRERNNPPKFQINSLIPFGRNGLSSSSSSSFHLNPADSNKIRPQKEEEGKAGGEICHFQHNSTFPTQSVVYRSIHTLYFFFSPSHTQLLRNPIKMDMDGEFGWRK
jgi:hypothetical protein